MKTRGSDSGSVYLGRDIAWSTGQTHNYSRVTYIKKESLLSSVGHPGPPFKKGGPFAMQRHTIVLSKSRNVHLQSAAGSNRFLRTDYDGVFVPKFTMPSYASIGMPALALDMVAQGTIGWARFKPGNPTASVGQFVAELRDLPRLPFSRLKHFRDLGSEYLNVEFGWKPFLSDLKRMYNTYKHYERQWAYLKRHAGDRGVRRGGTISSTQTVSSTETTGDGSILYPALVTALYGPLSQARKTVTTSIGSNIWFSAKYRYYLPAVPESKWDRRATAALFGYEPTPSLLYQVLPWSWLIDWFSSLGAMVDNLSSNAVDNLAAEYAFVMKHSWKQIDTVCSVPFKVGKLDGPIAIEPVTATMSEVSETKQRTAASPYGFGLTFPDLSTRQKAVISALGLSRRW